MLPQAADQFTATLAMNCCVWPWSVVAEAGVMVMGDVIVAVVDAVLPPLIAVAFTVQAPVVNGAVKDPLLAPIVPQEAVHVTGTLAVKDCAAPSLTVGLRGCIATAGAVPEVSWAYAT
jgi:hypothetical protein